MDLTGSDYTADSTSVATLSIPGGDENKPDQLIGEIDGKEVTASAGKYEFSLDMVVKPGTSLQLELTISSFDSYGNTIGFVNGEDKYKLDFSSRLCTSGEQYTDRYTCEPCSPGTFSFIGLTEISECPPCPEYGVCQDGELWPQAGYMRFHESSEVFVRCFYD